jgi:hypothetical protein
MNELLPVGIPGGINSNFAGIPDGSGIVRLGNETLALDSVRYQMWTAAFQAPEPEMLLDWATAAGVSEAESVVRTLRDARLIVQQRSDPRVVAAHAIRFIGTGMGNGREPESPFVLQGNRGAFVSCGLVVYEALLRSDGTNSITRVSDELQADAPQHLSVLQLVIESLPLLMRGGVIRLDLART